MIDLERIDRALEVLDVYFKRSIFVKMQEHFNVIFRSGKGSGFPIRLKCMGLVLHDRILTGRQDEQPIDNPHCKNKPDSQANKR